MRYFPSPKVYLPCEVFFFARFPSLGVSFLFKTLPPCKVSSLQSFLFHKVFLLHKVFLHARFPLLTRFNVGFWEQKWGKHPKKSLHPSLGTLKPSLSPFPPPRGTTREFEALPFCFFPPSQRCPSEVGVYFILFHFISPAR